MTTIARKALTGDGWKNRTRKILTDDGWKVVAPVGGDEPPGEITLTLVNDTDLGGTGFAMAGIHNVGGNLVVINTAIAKYSDDEGETWSNCTGYVPGASYSVIKANTRLFAYADGDFTVSTNGIAFSAVSVTPVDDEVLNGINGVAWDGTYYILTGSFTVVPDDPIIYRSTDGLNFTGMIPTMGGSLPGGVFDFRNVAAVGTTLVAIALGSGYYARSTNHGVNWTSYNNPDVGSKLNDITDMFCSLITGELSYSADGLSWSQTAFTGDTFDHANNEILTFANGYYWAVAINGGFDEGSLHYGTSIAGFEDTVLDGSTSNEIFYVALTALDDVVFVSAYNLTDDKNVLFKITS